MSTTVPPSNSPSSISTPTGGRSPRAGWWGMAFVVLLLLSAGMASVPGGSDSVAPVRSFYTDNGPVVLVAQLVGLAAAVAFVVHASALARVVPSAASTSLRLAGFLVAAAAVLTAVPVLLLTAMAGGASEGVVRGLARESDLTDVPLFATMAFFAIVAVRASGRSWLGGLAGIVAVLTAARAVLLAFGSAWLGLVAPLAFIALILVVSLRQLIRSMR